MTTQELSIYFFFASRAGLRQREDLDGDAEAACAKTTLRASFMQRTSACRRAHVRVRNHVATSPHAPLFYLNESDFRQPERVKPHSVGAVLRARR